MPDKSQKKEGTIFLVQGPPGIGKTALLDECLKKAKDKKWEVRELVISALWNPQEMRKCLKLDAEARPVEKTMGGEGRAGLPSWGWGCEDRWRQPPCLIPRCPLLGI